MDTGFEKNEAATAGGSGEDDCMHVRAQRGYKCRNPVMKC